MGMKYFIMASFCFATSLAMLVISIIAIPIIFRLMRTNKFYSRDYEDCDEHDCDCVYTTLTIIVFIAAACGFFANLFFIPSTIFIKYKDETTVLSAQY